jgi:cobalt-zinc-cadmium resistance protein CzcA
MSDGGNASQGGRVAEKNMLERILKFSIRQRLFVILAVAGIAVLGAHNFQILPIDAVPDITNIQVQINTEAPGFSPLEAEQRITFPIETALMGIPRLEETRSLSRYGLSQVTAIFNDGTDVYFARQQIGERLQTVKRFLPENLQPIMGPIATGLGEIFMWSVERDRSRPIPANTMASLMDLRTIQDWIVRPQLRNTPGVADVNTVGGYVKQYHVVPDPEKMISYKIDFRDILEAIAKNNKNIGAGYIEHNGEQYLIRAPGQVTDLEDLRRIVIGIHHGLPIFIRDVAQVELGRELRTGAATRDGEEIVLGTVFMLKGENSRTVSQSVAEKMEGVRKTLPPGVQIKVLYDRTNLVDATLRTVRNNLLEGALLVVVVLFVLLGNFRAALITALVIPLSMLFAVTGMIHQHISGNLLSLGAIDFGIIVDGAVIIVENCSRRLAEERLRLGRLLDRNERFDLVYQAAGEVVQPSVFGGIIIMIVYLPILTLTGIEGKMFQPMAITVLAALTGAMIFSITFIPAMVAQFVTGQGSGVDEQILKRLGAWYRDLLDRVLAARHATLFLALVLLAVTAVVALRMGSEFLPTLEEGDFAVHALRIPGTSLTQSVEMQDIVERKIREIPETDYVFTKIGTAEIATDPMPPSVADVFVMLKPREQWPDPRKTKDRLVRELEEHLASLPGNKFEFTQPIEMRFNELIAGVRSDVGVKIFGENLDTLLRAGDEVGRIVQGIPGAADVKVEQVSGLPMLTVHFKRPEMTRLGLNIADVQDVIEIAIGGKIAGWVFDGDRRFHLVMRLPENVRADIRSLERLPIPLPSIRVQSFEEIYPSVVQEGGHPAYLPLGMVAEFNLEKGPNQISRENGKRRVVVTANVRERDLGSFVRDAQKAVESKIKLEPGYWIEWGGQFEHMVSAARRLYLVVPIALFLIFILLFASLGSFREALMVFTGIPLALTGGVVFLWARGIPLSISAAVGFIALSGVAVLNGLVMVSFIRKLIDDGLPLETAVRQGSSTRLRPVLMTALVASLGFVPMALATGTGAEVQRPLATVVIGGILSSSFLTLFVLPSLYLSFGLGREKNSDA